MATMDSSSDDPLEPRLVANLAWVRRLALAIVRDASAADDLVQEVALAALQDHPRPASRSRDSLRAWLTTVVKRLAVDRGRSETARRAREQAVSRREPDEQEAAAVDRGARTRRVVEAVMGLPEPQRPTILLRYLDELSIEEVASKTGVSERTVRTRLASGLALLRAQLDREFGEDSNTWSLVLLARGTPGGAAAKSALVGGVVFMNAKWIVGSVVLLLLGFVFWRWNAPRPAPPPPLAVTYSERATSEPPAGRETASVEPRPKSEREDLHVATPPPAPHVAQQNVWFFRVVDDVTRHRLANAECTCASGGNQKISADAEGLLAVPAQAESNPRLWDVTAPGHARVGLIDAHGGKTRETATEIVMRAGSSLRACVVGADGQPASANVELSYAMRDALATTAGKEEFDLAYNGGPDTFRSDRSGVTGDVSSGMRTRSARTDSAGCCFWDQLPPGVAMTAVVAEKGRVVLRVPSFTLDVGEAREVQWSLPGSRALRVELVDRNGTPLGGEPVWIVDAREGRPECNPHRAFALFTRSTLPVATAMTGADGVASFESVPIGEAYIGPAYSQDVSSRGFDSHALAPVGALLQFQSDRPADVLRVTADQGLFVAGQASAHGDSTPPPKLRLRLSSAELCGVMETVTDESGSFVIGPLPQLPFTLAPSLLLSGLPLSPISAMPGDLAIVIEVPATVAFDVTVKDDLTGTALSIEAVDLSGSGTFVEQMVTGSTPSAHFEAIPAGMYTVVARTASGKIAVLESRELQPSATPARVELIAHACAQLDAHNGTSSSLTLYAYSGASCVGWISLAPGETEHTKLPPGRLRFTTARSGAVALDDKSIELVAGQAGSISWP